MTISRSLYLFCAIGAMALACGSGSTPNSANNAGLEAAIGADSNRDPQELYQEFCAGCHGEDLRKFYREPWKYGRSWNAVRASIRTGYPDAGMPSYAAAFSDQELDALTDFLLGQLEQFTEADFREEAIATGRTETERLNFDLEVVSDGFRVPWGIGFLTEGRLLVTERRGRLWLLDPSGKRSEIDGVPEVVHGGQGGLQDIETWESPAGETFVYLSFAKSHPVRSGVATTAVARGKLIGQRLEQVEIIFEAHPYVETRHHYGARLRFGPDGFLWITVGDRGRREVHPQDLQFSCGKVHRLHPDGSVPEDNPFGGTAGAVETIWSYGHRNPQGLAFHPKTGEVWTHEHGPRGGDELNQPHAGLNYGWPVVSYGINYDGSRFTDATAADSMEQPVHHWVPSIAPCGLELVGHERYGEWVGNALIGSLRYRYVERLELDGNRVVESEHLLEGIGRVREIQESPEGWLYVVAEDPGKVYRIVPQP